MKLFKASLLAEVVAASAVSQAFDTWNYSLVGDYNMGSPGIHASAGQDGNGAQIEVNGGGTFTGLDGSGATQTMTYAGTTRTSSQFGRLHSYTELTASNIYYNAANPDYQHADGSIDANGSPDGFTSLGFAGFNDTLHYGGTLQAGYKARYVFFCEGTNSGPGCLADLAFQIDGYSAESFFSSGDGQNVHFWGTQSYDINGITPQNVHVQFSNQVVFDLFNYADGLNLHGVSDYSSTLTLDHIEIVDANGALVSGVTVTSDSGTNYQVVPEPASIVAVGFGLLCIARRRKAR